MSRALMIFTEVYKWRRWLLYNFSFLFDIHIFILYIFVTYCIANRSASFVATCITVCCALPVSVCGGWWWFVGARGGGWSPPWCKPYRYRKGWS
jgi:hypothetical protein